MLDLNAVYFLKHLLHEFVIRDNFRFERKNSIDFVEKKKHTRNSTECTDKLYLLRVIHDWTVPKIIFVCKRITWYSKKIPYWMLFVIFFWVIFSLGWIQLPWVPLLIIRPLFYQFELLPSMNISKEGNKWFFSNNQRNDAMRLSERVKNHNCV